jgi:esterase
MARLNQLRFGEDAGGTPLVIAHGLFGSARNWRAIARALAASRPVVAVDMRNHGESVHSPDQGYADMAGDLAETIAALGGSADLLGHSMGGKAAMALALTQPGLLRRLVVADIAPVAYAHSHSGTITALRALDLAAIGSRAEADAALARDLPDPAMRAFLLQSLVLSDGPPRWMLNLPALDRAMAGLTGWPDLEGRFDGPALFLSGADSEYVLPAHHAAIRAQFPAAVFEAIPEAGHWLHADRPRAFIAAVSGFLSG